MATDTLEIFGTEYSGVTGIKATDSNNAIKTYIRPQGTKSITSSGTTDVTEYASASVASGSATAPASISGTSASVTTGTNTVTLSKTVSVTPSVSAGYVSSGTAGNSAVSLTASVTTKGATTYRAGTSQQTIASGTYLTGTQTIAAVSQTNLTAENIKDGTTISISNGQTNIWSVTGTYSGGGGPSNFTLLNTKSLGTISTSSTSATDTGQTITLTNWSDYDLLVVDISVNTATNNRHTSTVSFILVTGQTSVSQKSNYVVGSNKWNSKLSSNVGSTRQSTTAYGIYANSVSVSNGTMTIAIYQRYNATSTSTINGSYTARTYGVKLYDLIGG